MKRIFVCSPFRGTSVFGVADNHDMAERACRYVIAQWHAPFAPHLFYPIFLRDGDTLERECGLRCAQAWLEACDEVWTFGSRLTSGMETEVVLATRIGKLVVQHVGPQWGDSSAAMVAGSG